MRRTAIMTGVAAAAALLAVAGCTSGGAAKSSVGLSGPGSVPGPGDASAAATPAGGGGSASDAGGSRGAYSAQRVKVSSTAEIVIADMTVRVRDVPAQADAARGVATAAGGKVDGDDRVTGEHPSATLLLKVPPARLAGVLTSLSALGAEQSRQQSTQDVTSEVADVGSRLVTAQTSIERLTLLFDQAKKVSDIIAIENELAQRQAEKESLQARQRALSAQTAMATVTVHLVTKAATAGAEPNKSGVLGGLSRGWHNFTHVAGALLTGFAVALPFLAVLVLLGAGALVAWRRQRRHNPHGPPVPSPEPSPSA
jgi:hypothetical protein